jgi:hypothetical protein
MDLTAEEINIIAIALTNLSDTIEKCPTGWTHDEWSTCRKLIERFED